MHLFLILTRGIVESKFFAIASKENLAPAIKKSKYLDLLKYLDDVSVEDLGRLKILEITVFIAQKTSEILLSMI